MKHDYPDIIKRLGEPKWYDKNGTPRYDDFHPDLAPNVYARQVVLMEVKCQECGRKFIVETDWSSISKEDWEIGDLKTRIKEKVIGYGDPPRHNGCIGETMNAIVTRILEFWEEECIDLKKITAEEVTQLCEWKRRPEYEGDVDVSIK